MGIVTSTLIPGPAGGRRVTCRKRRRKPPPPPKCLPTFVSSPIEEQHRDFMKATCFLLLQQGLFWHNRRCDPPLRFKTPEQLSQIIDYELGEEGTIQPQLLSILQKIIHYSPHFGHPYFMSQLLAGIDPYAILGDIVSSTIPSTMLTYREAPVYYMMEEEVTSNLLDLFGFDKDTSDIIFPPGSAYANFLGILLARQWKFPETKELGTMHLPPLVIFVSQDAHSSYKKGAIYTSIGLENVVVVKTDGKGRMSISHLTKCIEETMRQGRMPLMVGATSGSEVYGAFDPLEELSRICQQYGMWLHSDGAFGGGVVFSEEQRKLRLKGVNLVDSFCVNFHKLGSATQTSSIFITSHKPLLKEACGLGYSIVDNSSYDSHLNTFFAAERDTYDKYMEQTRRADVVKLFIMWKAKGLEGLGRTVDDAYERARFFMEELRRRQKQNGKFIPILDEFECPVIPFFFVPPYLQKQEPYDHGIFKEQLNMHTSYLLAELIKNGIMVVTVQSHRNSALFFKVVFNNVALTNDDVVYLLNQIDNFGTYLRVPHDVPSNNIMPDDGELDAPQTGSALDIHRHLHNRAEQERNANAAT